MFEDSFFFIIIIGSILLQDRIIWIILKRGGDVNASDNSGQTALHWAAVRGSIAAADVLLQNGARVEAVDVNGYRVMFCWLVEYSYDVVITAETYFQ